MEITDEGKSATPVPHLNHLSEFEKALQNYHVGAEARRILDATKLAILVGPSSSGRNTIINELLATGGYQFLISDTTRPPRINNGKLEQNGVEYWFKSEEDMLAELKRGEFLEAEIIHGQQVSGTSVYELEKTHNNHKIALADVDIGGAQNIIAAKPDTAAILVLPPSFEEWHRRLRGRGAMTADEYRRRAQTALKIFSAPLEYDFFKIVINDDLEEAVHEVDFIVRTGVIDPVTQQAGRLLAEELYSRTKASLA